ncbi:MAG: deoxyuridine 5'-triphosphate nucleotidohydrolase [Halodesulfurarchaeum sp.]
MFRSGEFVADVLGVHDEAQIQPNGVDLRVDTIFEQQTPGRLSKEGTEIGDRTEVDPERVVPDGTDPGDAESSGVDIYTLDRGGYIVQYEDPVTIPEEHIGFVLPRSSLMRNSCMLNTAVWDAGYSGRGEGLLQVHHPVEIERGARIAQLVFAEADHEGLYDGSFQGERLD